MKVAIELHRVGHSRVSYQGIPLQAFMVQGSVRGENILKGKLTDVAGAKAAIQFQLEQRFRSAVEIEWIDKTGDL